MFGNSLNRPNVPQVVSQAADDSLADIGLDSAASNPSDSVSSIQWIPNPAMKIFACSTWDAKIHLYDTITNGYQKYITQKAVFTNDSNPILTLSWKKDCSMLFAGCGDNSVKAFDVSTGKSMLIGTHDAPVHSVYWIEQMNVLMTMSFNQQIKFWQLNNPSPALALTTEHKIFVSDFNFPFVFLGMNNEQLALFDINQIQSFQNGKVVGNFLTPLGTQTNSLSLFPRNDGYGIGSIDGRANLSSFSKDSYSNSYKSVSKMTFKCHKIEEGNNVNILLPVHSIGFHPNSKSFVFTAGGDGCINYWDYEAKNKIKSFNFKGAPVTRAKISDDGQFMAYALGYDWQKGIWGMDPNVKPRICVHAITENELKYNAGGNGGSGFNNNRF